MRKRLLEFIILFLVCSVILAGADLPNWYGRSLENDSLSFRGQYFDTQDYAVDIAMMRAGMQGDWTYRLRFTTEEHQAVSIRLFYLALGHVSGWLNLDPEGTFDGARWVFGYLALFAIFYLCSYYFKKKLLVWAAFLLAVLGSGLGWLQLLAGWQFGAITPIDFWLIDAYVFFSLSLFPHFSCTIALMAAGLLCYLNFLKCSKWRMIGLACLAAIPTQMVNPIAFVVVDAAVFFATLFTFMQDRTKAKRLFLALTVLALVQIPLLIYNFNILSLDPIWNQYTAQNITLSPSPVHYLFGFGMLLVLAAVGTVMAAQKRSADFLGLAGWLICGFVLVYSPTLIQRRFLIGVTIPLSLLSVLVLDVVFDWLERRTSFRKPLGFVVVVFLFSISSIYLIFGNLQVLKSLPEKNFYPSGMNAGFTWLKENADPAGFVLGAETTGQLVAQKTGLRVYLGHEMETIHYEEKNKLVADWYRSNFPQQVLADLPVKWVVYGPYEQEFAPDFQPGEHLVQVFSNPTMTIFEVK